MITADDVAAAVVARTAALASFVAAVPGKAWFDRGPDVPDAYPYAVFKLKAGEQRRASGTAYAQAWACEFAVYAPVGAAGVNQQSVQQALADCFVTAAGRTQMRAAALRNATEKVLDSRATDHTAAAAKELREGRDVFAAGLSFELLVQGDRSVS